MRGTYFLTWTFAPARPCFMSLLQLALLSSLPFLCSDAETWCCFCEKTPDGGAAMREQRRHPGGLCPPRRSCSACGPSPPPRPARGQGR